MAHQIFFDHENKLNYVESMHVNFFTKRGGKKDEKQMRRSLTSSFNKSVYKCCPIYKYIYIYIL